MIQDVKLGTHRIGTYMYAISKCAFLLGFRLATRRAQIVWLMMTVTVTNFEGFTRQQFCKNVNFGRKCTFSQIFQNCCLVKPSKFVTVTVIIGHTDCGHTPFHTHIN